VIYEALEKAALIAWTAFLFVLMILSRAAHSADGRDALRVSGIEPHPPWV
jgi:hypothetical protein